MNEEQQCVSAVSMCAQRLADRREALIEDMGIDMYERVYEYLTRFPTDRGTRCPFPGEKRSQQ